MTSALSMNSALGPQITHFWRTQEKILAEAERYTRHWFARRQEAVRSAMRACEEAAAVSPAEPIGLVQSVRDWQAHSAERVAEDVREWIDLCARCAGHAVSEEVDARAETLDEIQRQTVTELHPHHATPV